MSSSGFVTRGGTVHDGSAAAPYDGEGCLRGKEIAVVGGLVAIDVNVTIEDAAAASRASAVRAERIDQVLATTGYTRAGGGRQVFTDSTRSGGATEVPTYNPRIRPDTPVWCPIDCDRLDDDTQVGYAVHTVSALVAGGDPGTVQLPNSQRLPTYLLHDWRTPIARVRTMHEGQRRCSGRRQAEEGS